jgi:hypothetical protein
MLAGKIKINRRMMKTAARLVNHGIHKAIPNTISKNPVISLMNFLLVKKGGMIL